jgi:hypothetical protein
VRSVLFFSPGVMLVLLVLLGPPRLTARAAPAWAAISAVADDVSEQPLGPDEPALVGLPLVVTLKSNDSSVEAARLEWEPGKLSPRVAFDPDSQTADFRTSYSAAGSFDLLPRPSEAEQAPPGTPAYRLVVESRAEALKRIQTWIRARLQKGDQSADAVALLQAADRLLERAGESLAAGDEAGFMNRLVYASEQLASVDATIGPAQLPYYRRLTLVAWVTARQRIDQAGAFDDETAEQDHLKLAEEWLHAGEGMLRRGDTTGAISPFELALAQTLEVK